jgi:hypothetical protein
VKGGLKMKKLLIMSFMFLLITPLAYAQNQVPDCSDAYASPDLLKSNGKMVPIEILGVTDPDGDPVTITVTSVTSDEATATEPGAGGYNKAPDASGVGTSSPMVRAERSGRNDGRVYVINFIADDGQSENNLCNGSVVVFVPLKGSYIDSGQKYDATKIN